MLIRSDVNCKWPWRGIQSESKRQIFVCAQWDNFPSIASIINTQSQRITVRGECEIITKSGCVFSSLRVCVWVFMCGCCFRSQRDCHTKLNRTKKSITWMWCRSFCFYIDFFANCKSYLLCVSCCLNWINAFFLFVCLSVVNNYSYYVIFYFLFSLTSTSVVFCMV